MMTEFHVKGYKSLADVKIPLTHIHVLIGQNDSGKTSVLEAILALSRSTEKPLAEAFEGSWTGRELVFHGSEESTIQLGCSLNSHQGAPNFEYLLPVEFASPPFRFCQHLTEQLFCNGEKIIDTFIAGVASKSMLYEMHDSMSTKCERLCEQIKALLAPAHYYRIDPKIMGLAANLEPDRRFRMESDGFGLSTMIDDIINEDREVMNAIEAEFIQLFPEFKRIKLTQSLGTKRTYQSDGSFTTIKDNGKAIVFVTKDGRDVRAQQASDGALLFLGFLALTRLPNPPKFLLIEEPERGLYPKRLEELARILKQPSEKINSGQFPQIILTTHSPYLISSFAPEQVTLMRRESDGSSQAYPLSESELIRENLPGFYLGEVWFNFTEDQIAGKEKYVRLH